MSTDAAMRMCEAMAMKNKDLHLAPCSFFRAEYTLNHKLGTMHMPHIALLDGIVMGGGAGVSVHGHFRIATER